MSVHDLETSKIGLRLYDPFVPRDRRAISLWSKCMTQEEENPCTSCLNLPPPHEKSQVAQQSRLQSRQGRTRLFDFTALLSNIIAECLVLG